jgi:predicted transcriptional regulator of viral defense system
VNYLEFKKRLFDLGGFYTHQVFAWDPGFNRNNLGRWTERGMLIRLRRGYYTFPEYKEKVDFPLYFANQIYRPSYISLHTALSFYGMIPETIIQFTSVSSLKTASFSNELGEYHYKSIRSELMFGYKPKPMDDGRVFQMASAEKALLDLLYLYPFYNTAQELENLRLDEDFLENDLDIELLSKQQSKFKNRELDKRVKLLLKTYEL